MELMKSKIWFWINISLYKEQVFGLMFESSRLRKTGRVWVRELRDRSRAEPGAGPGNLTPAASAAGESRDFTALNGAPGGDSHPKRNCSSTFSAPSTFIFV